MFGIDKLYCMNLAYKLLPMTPAERDEVGMGSCNTKTLVVKIDDTQHELNQLETLWHESLHIMWAAAKLKETVDEEECVDRLSPILITFIRDNPELVAMAQGYDPDGSE